MGKATRKIQAEQLEKEEQIKKTLTKTDYLIKKRNKKDRTSILLPTDLLHDYRKINDLNNFKTHSYNLDTRSKEALIYLFCKYKVPKWILELFYEIIRKYNFNIFSEESENNVVVNFNYIFFKHLFITLGIGKSNKEQLKPYLSKQEIVIFNTIKTINYDNISDIIFYCKMKAKNIKSEIINAFIEKIHRLFTTNYYKHEPFRPFHYRLTTGTTLTNYSTITNTKIFNKLCEYIDFIARYENISKNCIEDIFDFIKKNDFVFSFKNRTLKSVMKVVNAWHEELAKKALEEKLRRKELLNKDYVKSSIHDWYYFNGKYTVECKQLLNYQELVNEGRKMHHCVASYAEDCALNNCQIFSLREANEILATIELKGNKVVQKRAVCNGEVKGNALSYFKMWCKARGLTDLSIK